MKQHRIMGVHSQVMTQMMRTEFCGGLKTHEKEFFSFQILSQRALHKFTGLQTFVFDNYWGGGNSDLENDLFG